MTSTTRWRLLWIAMFCLGMFWLASSGGATGCVSDPGNVERVAPLLDSYLIGGRSAADLDDGCILRIVAEEDSAEYGVEIEIEIGSPTPTEIDFELHHMGPIGPQSNGTTVQVEVELRLYHISTMQFVAVGSVLVNPSTAVAHGPIPVSNLGDYVLHLGTGNPPTVHRHIIAQLIVNATTAGTPSQSPHMSLPNCEGGDLDWLD